MSGSESGVLAAKHDFSATYDQPWPHAYYQAHLALDYMICDRARPVFERIIEDLRRQRLHRPLKIIDVGASYGLNAALLSCRLSLDDLYAAYTLQDGPLATRNLEDHQAFFTHQLRREDLEFVGLDPSRGALGYARDVGLIGAAVAENLETEPLSETDREALRDADLIISTGCVGYATVRTFQQVYEAAAASRPWVASFAMHPFGYEDIAAMLAGFGLVTTECSHLQQRQRRFSTAQERTSILALMAEQGMDDRLERATGYIYAAFHLSTPREDSA
ncbi:hypothetical protein FHS55_004655 [Angulomicrobium tetraedrale]|uniref:Class I SAM-dependent methyltransferase n=1 Tax=Ancylobacter tetraedralis TaxID=217068 RepID=A0A839ZHJ3_9HYPH|nr:hypothetical protein [Ancylobacter tetraedralis]MBB3774005.1 hypothetical protein [Ancylobacter tetraedralis]